ncbi:hypothetical protein [Streptomyces sp. NPDC058773]|uniref:hypothetical protein n=1 Tax=Streptomyces sp. NPDC058773 TaxID=3346632 RepID=UPI0036ADE4C5
MTHEMTPRRSGARAAAALLAVCSAMLGFVVSPLATGTARAEDAATTVSVQSASKPGQYVNAVGTSVLNWDAPEVFEFDFNDDGTFHIKSGTDGQCIDKWRTNDSGVPRYKQGYLLTVTDCHDKNAADPTTDSQNWYLVPVNEGGAGNAYYIVNAGERRCMDDQMIGGEIRKDKYVPDLGRGECSSGRASQQFILEDAAQRSDFTGRLHQKALSAAFKMCGVDPDSCSYEAKSYGDAQPVGEECVNQWWKNPSKTEKTTGHYTRGENEGWQHSVGTTVTVGAEFGVDAGVVSKVSTSVSTSYQKTWSHIDLRSTTWDFPISPGNYGWVVKIMEKRDVTGTWTFSSGPMKWSAEGTSTVTYAEGYSNKDEPAPPPPGSCPGT